MPVRFYPDKPIELLKKYVVDDKGNPLHGEIAIYRMLFDDLSKSPETWHVWHNLKLPTHSPESRYGNKTSAQIDFLILCKHGIMVIEVKGGPISCRDNSFFYGKNFETKMNLSPFMQAEGYKFTLKDDILKNLNGYFFCDSVCFPHVDYPFFTPETKVFDENRLWTKYSSHKFNDSIENFIISVFEYDKGKHRQFNRKFPNLSQKEIDAAKRILSPIIEDRNKFDSSDTLNWLQINNIEILEGLYKNPRIMIEGPPGSGKTTMAKAFIDRQKGSKGLYLCWNNFLMSYTKQILKGREGLEDVEVTTFFKFIKKLNPGMDTDSFLRMPETEFYEQVKDIMNSSEKQGELPYYDYIVIDEAQDVFDRGLDLLLANLCGYNRDGLNKGNALVLYDIDQSYAGSGRNVLEMADLISQYFAHFKLNEIKRSAQNSGIRELSKKILDDPSSLPQCDSDNIRISRHKNLEKSKTYIVNQFLDLIRRGSSSLRGKDCIILVESPLLKESYKDEPGMRYWLTIKDVEELDENNVADTGNKLRYTSILKFKGLERQTVFLVTTAPNDKNKYELYVGITRAISNLEILVVE